MLVEHMPSDLPETTLVWSGPNPTNPKNALSKCWVAGSGKFQSYSTGFSPDTRILRWICSPAAVVSGLLTVGGSVSVNRARASNRQACRSLKFTWQPYHASLYGFPR